MCILRTIAHHWHYKINSTSRKKNSQKKKERKRKSNNLNWKIRKNENIKNYLNNQKQERLSPHAHIHIVTVQNDKSVLPACIRLMDKLNPQSTVCFTKISENMIPLENKVHPQTSWYQQGDGSLLLIASSKKLRESRSRDAALRLHLMLRRRAEGGGGGSEKDFFLACDKSCSHMGGTRPRNRTKGWLEWSQWSIQQQSWQEVCWCTPCYRLHRGEKKKKNAARLSQWDSQRTVKELVPLVSTIACQAFPSWAVWASPSAQLLFYQSSQV